MAAAAIAETILSTHGGGSDWDTALKLSASVLDTLESANEELCSRLLVHFLWRWAGFLGIQPHIECCSDCEAEDAEKPLWFHARENHVLCGKCNLDMQGLIQLSPGCRRWLMITGTLEPSNLYRYSMDNKSFNEAKALTTAVMTSALGKQLTSWNW